MADANARINIDINTSAAAAGLRQLQSQITAFNSTLTKSSTVQATAMRNSTQNMLEMVNASRFFSAETVRMQTAAASLDTTLKKGQGTLGTFLGAKFRKNSLAAAQVMSLANTRAQALQTQFVATGAAANGMRDAIAIRPLQAFNNAAVVSAQKLAIHRAMLNQATTSMINFGKNTQWTGRQLMVGFTVPLTIFGGVAGKVFRDLEKEAVNFKKVYGDSFTPPEEMEANLNAVKELAKEYTKYGIAVKDTVGLAAEAAAAGAQNEELIEATTQATRLATLGQMEQNEALKTTISLQNAFKLSGDELANSINFLNMVENQTVVTLQDLSGAIPRVAPVIKGLGGDVRDLATFLAAMQEGGVSAAEGSMALKSGLASLINPTEKAKERLAEMGISIDTIIQSNKGDLMGTIQALAAALDTLDQFGRQQAIEELFGKFQYARLAALFDNINKEGTQAARVMEISAMSAAEMAASAEKELGAIEEAVGTKFVAAMEQLKLAIAPIGEIFTKMAIPVINFLAKIADAFNNLPDGAKTFIGIATAIVGIVIPAGTMFLGLLVNLIGTLVKFGSTVGIAFRGFLSGGIKGAFDAVSQSTKYMSLADIDAANSAQQLAGSTEAVNKALLGQVGSSETAQAAIMELAYAYEILTTQMREAALQSKLVFGPGAAAMGNVPGRGPIRRNRGGSIPGSGNTDTVPAMLTPGEFVVNKKSTQENLGLLKYINQGGNVPGFNIGGLLAATGAAVRSRSLLSGAQVAGALGVSERTLRRISASAGLPKDGGKYLYTPETIPTLAAQTNVRMQKTHTTPFRSITTMPSTIPGSSQRAQLSKLMAGAGIPIQVVDDAWLLLPSGVNQKLRAGGVKGSQLLEAIEDFSRQPGFFGPAYKNVDKQRFISSLRSSIRPDAMYTDYGQGGGLNAGALFWSAARKSAPQGGFIPTQVGGYTANTQTFRNSVGTLNKRYAGQYSFYLDETGKKPVMRVFDSKGNRVLTEDIQASAGWGFNRGSLVPGQGNKDTVPAMLTPGEFVVNKKATQSNMALLKAINDGTIKGYAAGDIVEGADATTRRPVYFVENPDGTQTRYDNKRGATKAARAFRGRGGMLSGGRGMGLSMGMSMLGGAMFMGSGQIQNATAQTALQAGGTALGVASMLPMLGGMAPMLAPLAGIAAPAAAVAAGLAVAGVAVYKWRQSVDEAARSAANFGANLGGTANSFNQIASLMGTMTPAQRQAALQIGFDQEAQSAISEQFSAMFGTEEGQQFITDLENATSEERFKKLSDYLKAGIAAGMMDTEMASNLAKAVSVSINDAVLGARVVGAISSQETGAGAVAEMARARAENVSSLSEFTRVVKEQGILLEQTDAAKIIGGSIQTIQDYSNATALAREQLAKGEITQEQYSKIISESESQQALFTKAIEESLLHTRDFGGTMQATLDQLTKAGLATEEGLQNLSKAAEEARFGRNVPGAVGTQQNLFAAGIAAVAGGMEQGIAAAIIERIGQDERAQESFAQLSRAGVGGAQALAGTEFVSQILSGQMFGDRMRGQQLGVTAARAQQFSARGGDITGAQAYLLSQPLEERAGVAQSFFALRDEDKSTLIKDYQDLAQNAGAEFARNLVDSEEYREALKEGSTEEFTQSIKRASSIFGEETESIMGYAKRTGISLEELSNQAERLASLPDELIFKLGIDFTDPADMEKFGPMADQLKASWPILSQLPPELDLRAFVETNTLENGQLAPISKIADGVVKVTKAYAALDSTESDVVKKASIEIMTAQGSTLEAAESTFKTLIDNMKDFNNFNLQSKYALITLQTAIDEVGLKMSLIQQAVADGDMPASAALNQIESLSGKRGALQAELDVAKVQAEITARAPSAKSGGGTPEKTLAEQLEEQRKLVESFADRFGSKRGVKLLAKPFGPEFLQYLKSQGQKGLDMLKGNFKKMRSAYKDFAAAQKAESLVVLQFMPGKLTEELQARKNSLQIVKQIAKEEGMSLQTATKAVEVLDATQQADYISLLSKNKRSKEDKKRLSIYKEILKLSKETALFDEKHAEVMQFMNMSAEERESARISNLQDIQSINRQIEEINVLEPLQKQLDAQQKIIDASQRAIELKQRESDEISRAIELKERELEPLDEQIEKLEEQQDKVQEIYDEQIEALDKIFEQESEIIALREKSLDVADALSTGDIAAAARAQMQLQSELAAQRREDQRSLLEAQNEAEIAAIDEEINDIKEKRIVIEEEVERMQLRQRNIQDEIYKLNQNQIPVQDEIYRLQQRIASETDRLNSKYNDTNLRLQSLNAQLRDALATQNAINTAAADENRIRAQKAQQAAAVAPPPSVAQAPIVTGEPPSTPFTGWSEEFAADPIMIYSPDQIIANIEAMSMGYYGMGGKVKKYAMGGMVNYKGSREPAPGFAMGGRVKKYAYGSIVPGIGATDKVPAMLTPGEFVVRKSVAQTYGPLLSAINGNVFPKMGGSSAMPRESAKGSGSMYNYNVNVTLNGSDMNPDDVANAVMRKIKMTENTRVRGYNTRG